MQIVRNTNKHNSEHIYELNGFMYAIYLFTVLGEPISMNISYRNTILAVIMYVLASSIVIYMYDT